MNTHRSAPGLSPRLRPRGRALGVALAALFVLPAVADAQSAPQRVTGTVTESGASTPVEGAMVVLLDGDRIVDRVLTDARGAFVLAVPTPGRYELRIDRIGYASTHAGAFDIADGETVVRSVTTSVEPIVLEGLGVTAAGRCDDRSAGEVALVWDEVRKALEAAQWTADRELYRMAWVRWVRQLDADAERILDEQRERRRTLTTRPFAAADPDSLAASGFVRDVNGNDVFSAPDAEVLLSDAFLDGHCFGLATRSEEGRRLVGLSFEPLEGRRLPDVEGVLWIEEESGRLETLEYEYVNLGRVATVRGDDAHGELRFRALPNGTWIVEEWSIRMPRLLDVRDDVGRTLHYDVAGYVEEGGSVRSITTREGALVSAYRSSVVGTVTDSAGAPAVGARVSIAGTDLETTTDARGAFRIDEVSEGTWTVVGRHSLLDAYGHQGTRAEVVVARSGEGRVSLPLPSVRDIALERCRSTPLEGDENGILLGRVVGTDGGGAPGADVRVTWTAFLGAVRRTVDGLGTYTDDRGAFVLCGVPTDATLVAAASAGEGLSGAAEVRVPETTGVAWATVRLEPSADADAEAGADAEMNAGADELRVGDEEVERWLRSVGFDLRRGRALVALTDLEIAETGHDRLPRILDDQPRLESEVLPSGESVVWLHPATGSTTGGERCRLDVYLNGNLVRYRLERYRGLGLDATIMPHRISALEVFEGAAAPVGTPDSCGALLLWVDEARMEDDPPFVGSVYGRAASVAGQGRRARLVLRPSGVEAMIDDAGRFDFGPVPPARYVIEAELPVWGTLCVPVEVRHGSRVEVVLDPALEEATPTEPGGATARSVVTTCRPPPR